MTDGTDDRDLVEFRWSNLANVRCLTIPPAKDMAGRVIANNDLYFYSINRYLPTGLISGQTWNLKITTIVICTGGTC